MSAKNAADLITENTAVIGSQTSPNTITPTTDAAFRKDMIDSFWTKLDGVTNGYVTPLIIPARFTGLISPTGTPNDTSIQKLMDASQADAELIAGGVQGVPGQFLAIVTADTNQIFERATGTTVNAKVAKILFPNDKDGGGFDNGNNFLLSKYTVPAGGFSAFYGLSGFSLKLLSHSIYSLALVFTVNLCKNGAVIATSATTPTILPGSTDGTTYLIDDIRTTVTPTAADVLTVEVWASAFVNTDTAKIQILSGFFYNEQ